MVTMLVTITPLLRFMCSSGILWFLTGTWCCDCLLHLAYVLAICVCVVLDCLFDCMVTLLVKITPLLRFMCSSGILWCLTGTWCCDCLLHLAYVLAICVCVVLDWHLVVCVGYMCVTGTWSYVLAICVCVVLDLVCLVLATLWLYVKPGAWHAPDARGEWPL